MSDALHDAGNGVTWADSTQRVREFRKRKQLGLGARTREQAQKLVELGYLFLESKGDPQKEGVAVETYLGDNL